MRLELLRTRRRGFTLIEILIVVIILGILAAIVIPQFAGATTDTKRANVQATASNLRTAVTLYRAQHNETLLPPNNNFWAALTTQTDATGAPYTASSTTGPFGPYMQSIPVNAMNNSTVVIDAAVPAGGTTTGPCGWEYDYNNGAGSGAIYGTGTDGVTVIP